MNLLGVKYVGTKLRKADNVANSGLVWTPGQVHLVPANLAVRFFAHPTVWMPADEEVVQDPSLIGVVMDAEQTTVEDAEDLADDPLNLLPDLKTLPKAAIVQLAKREFGVDLDAEDKKDALIHRVRSAAAARSVVGKLANPGKVAPSSAPEPAPVVEATVELAPVRVQGAVEMG